MCRKYDDVGGSLWHRQQNGIVSISLLSQYATGGLLLAAVGQLGRSFTERMLYPALVVANGVLARSPARPSKHTAYRPVCQVRKRISCAMLDKSPRMWYASYAGADRRARMEKMEGVLDWRCVYCGGRVRPLSNEFLG